ncbi:hypothetical protein T10_13565 [Trichinella papuae]|uniref:Uncharacterized protein n=1 Tax=Trichinella papuae TaxID=268474 RepID=A0A0V1N390_9BILA|nr:hypothetical protein T10_13565 [Trichinella papuae]
MQSTVIIRINTRPSSSREYEHRRRAGTLRLSTFQINFIQKMWKRPLVRIPLLVDLLICALLQSVQNNLERKQNVKRYLTCNDVLCLGHSFVIVFSQIIVLLG